MGLDPLLVERCQDRLQAHQCPRRNRCRETFLPLGIQAAPLLDPGIGFFEWQKQGTGRKQPFFISPRDGELFSFAGLWERWHDPEGEEVETCTILTTTANELMAPIHDRMPVILSPSAEEQWLDPRASADALRSLLVPYSSECMEARPVGLWVNNPKNDGPRCLEPA